MMFQRKHTLAMRVIALIICLSVLSPCMVHATVEREIQSRASHYLAAYQTYICPVGNGEVQVWFNVTGAGTQDELGTLSILLYESTDNQNWTRVKTFLHEKNSNMLAYNTGFHMSHVSYQGVAGRYYKAYVCIWGGSDGNGDTRYLWAPSEQAT